MRGDWCGDGQRDSFTNRCAAEEMIIDKDLFLSVKAQGRGGVPREDMMLLLGVGHKQRADYLMRLRLASMK